MAKKILLAVIFIILISIFALNYISKDSVDVFIDGENITVTTHTLSNSNSKSLNSEICNYTLEVMNDTTSSGTSMLPTLQDGQKLLLNKTKNIHVGDIVVANSDEYGGIIKRVGDIEGDRVYLESDNKNINYEFINDTLYELKGITTWVNISDINGVIIDY